MGEINNGKENINTLPYTKTILLGAEPIKKAKISLKQIKIMIKKLKKIQKKDLKIFIQEIKTKVPFSEIKNRKPDKKYSTKGKNSKKRKHHKINKRKNIDKQKGGTMYCLLKSFVV